MDSFFIKSSGLKLFIWIYILPLFVLLVTSRFNTSIWIYITLGITLIGSILWLFVAGTFAYKNSQNKNNLNFKLFKISFIVVAAGIVITMLSVFSSFIISWPFALAFITASLYLPYFFSKALTSAEFRRETGPMTYLGTFIFLTCIPIGILLVQPRVQKLNDSTN